jgi:hypothetical protein
MSVSIEGSFAEATAGLSLACENRGVVAVDKGALQSRAVCSCVRCGGQHLMLAVVVCDAHLRSAHNRCRPAVAVMARDLTVRASAISSN